MRPPTHHHTLEHASLLNEHAGHERRASVSHRQGSSSTGGPKDVWQSTVLLAAAVIQAVQHY